MYFQYMNTRTPPQRRVAKPHETRYKCMLEKKAIHEGWHEVVLVSTDLLSVDRRGL